MKQTFVISIVAAAFISLSAYHLPRAYADPGLTLEHDPIIKLSVDESSHFDQAINAIARQANTAIIVEGRPLHATLTAEIVKTTPGITSGHLSTVLAALCKAYDYEVVDSPGITPLHDVLEMRKRYSHPYDLPDVTVGECLADLADAERQLNRFAGPSNPDRTQIINDAFNGVSADQRSALSNTGIPIRDLDGQQQDRFSRVARYFYLNRPLETLNQCRFVLASLHRFEISLVNEGGREQLVVKMVDRFGTIQRPLYTLARGVPISASLPVRDLPDLKQVLTARPSTLADTVSGVPSARVEIASILAPKSITVAGARYASPPHLVRALADVYGLRASGDRDGNWQIGRPSVPAPAKLTDVASSVIQSLPLPLVAANVATGEEEQLKDEAAFLRNAMANRGTKSTGAQGAAAMASIRSSRRDLFQGEMRRRQRPGLIVNECVRRLEFLYQEKTGGKPGVSVPIKDLGPEGERDCAVLVMEGFYHALQVAFQEGPPSYIRDFDNAFAVGGQDGSDRWVGLAMPRPGGTPFLAIRMSIPNRLATPH